MATSGTYTHNRNRDAIIKRAARLVSAIAAGEEPDAATVTDFSDALNDWALHQQTHGVNIWTVGEATLFPQLDQVRYTLSSTSTDHATESFVQTTLSADEASGQTVLSITSVTGISDNDYIGIVLDDGTIHWSTVNGAPGATVTIDNALASAAASGNRVFAYTTKLVRPLKILSARSYNFTSLIDTPIDEFDRIEYQELPNKTSEGSVNGYFYDRRGGANASGLLYLWQEPDSVDEAIKFTFARPIQDFAAASNDADFPREWFQTLVFNLANVMKVEYDVPEPRSSRIEKMAAQYLADVEWWERELTEVQFVPARR